VMAFWNAPLEQADHAVRACRTALLMQAAEAEIREELLGDRELRELLAGDAKTRAAVEAMGKTALYTRIGINTGPMNVGNWGSARKFQYTVIGDAVNSGARLEPANKRYGTRILVSGDTARLVRGEFLLRRVDVTRVKGKTQAMEVFELMAEGTGTEAQRGLAGAYDEAFELYTRREWETALERLAALEARFGADGAARMLRERISTLMSEPNLEWDGVYTATDK
jgi:adenylate cyclase